MREHDRTDAAGQSPGYERKDIPARLPFGIIVFMILFVPLGLFIVWALMASLWRVTAEPASPFGESSPESPSLSRPQLQTAPVSDYATFSEDIARHLQQVGWVDRDAGIVHLPIEQAKQLLLERGLTEATQPPAHSRIPLDPEAATQWLEAGPAAEPVIPEGRPPASALPGSQTRSAATEETQ